MGQRGEIGYDRGEKEASRPILKGEVALMTVLQSYSYSLFPDLKLNFSIERPILREWILFELDIEDVLRALKFSLLFLLNYVIGTLW